MASWMLRGPRLPWAHSRSRVKVDGVVGATLPRRSWDLRRQRCARKSTVSRAQRRARMSRDSEPGRCE
eukprot:15442408-Alexandrium_andersonii.AAC.1